MNLTPLKRAFTLTEQGVEKNNWGKLYLPLFGLGRERQSQYGIYH
jgi:hypothetical protein